MEYDLQDRDDFAIDVALDVDGADVAFEIGAPADPTTEPGEPGDRDGEPAGELEIEILDAIEEELADVERALERLGAGTYGQCETCGEALSGEELRSAPAGRFCPTHRVGDRL